MLAAWICIFILFLLRILYDPVNFADYNSYQIIIEQIAPVNDRGLFEFVSYKTFDIFSNAFDFGSISLYWLYIYNFMLVSCIYLYAVKVANISPEGVLITMALFAPLLFFVLLRAAPAYVLIMTGLLINSKNKKIISTLCILFAPFIHISAILPLLIYYLIKIRKFRELKFLGIAAKLVYVFGFLHIISFVLGYNLIPEIIGSVFQGFDNLSKYSAYTKVENNFSIFHYLFLIISLFVFYKFRSYRNFFDPYLYAYGHWIMLIYSIMMINPIVGFRVSIYFYLPVLAIFPWRKIFNSKKIYIVYAMAPLVFVQSFTGVLIK